MRQIPGHPSLVVTIFVSLFLGICNVSPHPSDRAMEERLRSNEGDFNQLVNMLNEDSGVVRIGYDYAFLTDGGDPKLSKERLAEYRRLFKKLNLEAGLHRPQPEVIRLIASTRGTFFSNSEKSFVYTKSEPSPVVESLDDVIEIERGDQKPVYKKLGGNWYLYYESW